MGEVWLSGEAAASTKHLFEWLTYEYKNKGDDCRINGRELVMISKRS